MNAKTLAALLNGREYRKEITRDEEAAAKAAGLVVVFGASDDLMEFCGAIDDELGCYDGTSVLVDINGIVPHREEVGDDDDELEAYLRRKSGAKHIDALWCEEDGYSWTYRTEIPHETFEITDDGQPYCKGIVFALKDVPAVAQPVYREDDIIAWGVARNLIGPTGEATRVGQQAKTEEEVQELQDAIAADDIAAARDAIGDVYVTLVMQAQMWGLTMQECIEAAWQEIKDRKGRMINGVFVKE